MEQYISEPPTAHDSMWGALSKDEPTPSLDTPMLELEPEQAPAVFAEAVQVLRGSPDETALHRAAIDIRAACDAGLHEACQYARAAFIPAERISGEEIPYPMEMLKRSRFGLMSFLCRLDTEGRVHDCKTLEGEGLVGVEQVRAVVQTARFRPATLAGHPVGFPYTFNVRFAPTGRTLTTAERLAWARLRVAQYPQSASAWNELAEQLAKHAPADPLYPQVVTRALALNPRFWWPATEVAWQRVQAGQYAAAMMAVRLPLRRERGNPYVLETGAAAHFGLGECSEALKAQERAVGLLPEEWPEPERERFQLKLKDYQTACAAPAVTAAPDPR